MRRDGTRLNLLISVLSHIYKWDKKISTPVPIFFCGIKMCPNPVPNEMGSHILSGKIIIPTWTFRLAKLWYLRKKLERRESNVVKEKAYYSQECVRESLGAYKYTWFVLTSCMLKWQSSCPIFRVGLPLNVLCLESSQSSYA